MPINPGKLNRRVTRQARVPASPNQEATGEPVDVWTDVGACWASIEPSLGGAKESLGAQQLGSVVTSTITIRYASGVDASQRILYGTRIYNIVAVVDPKEAHEILQLLCTEGENEG